MGAVPDEQRRDIERLYDAFNSRDIEAVLDRLADDVCWANGLEGGHVEGRASVREYWTRQFTVIDPRVEPEEIRVTDSDRLLVRVRQTVRSLDGEVLADQRVDHVYTFRGGLITRFDIGEGTAR